VTWTQLSGSEGQGHQATLITAVLARQAAAAVSVGTYWPWELTATLPSADTVGSATQGVSALTEGGQREGIFWRPPAYSVFSYMYIVSVLKIFSVLVSV